MPIAIAQKTADRAWIAVLAIGLPLLGALLMRTDGNWDLRNYHLYNAHAWLAGRTATDIAAAQLQTWHNPLLDLPFYLLVTSGMDLRWASLWLAVPCMASLFFLLRLQSRLSPEPVSRTSQCVLAFLAITGAATYSTLGLSMNDAFVGAAMLCSLWLVIGRDAGRGEARAWLLAGVVAGAMAGLKLTAVVYCIGLAVTSVAAGAPAERIRRLGALAIGGIAGFLLTYGYWGWRLFATYGNPFFPYYNNLFHSPDALPADWADVRFRPHSLGDALLAPVHLLQRSQRYSEIFLSDPRLLLAILSLGLLAWLHWKKLLAGRNEFVLLLVFVLASFLPWILQYGIYRYATVLELLGCLALVLALQRLPRARHAAMLLAALLVTADTKRPNWGRIKATTPWYGVRSAPIPDDSLVLLGSGEPLAYLALGLPTSVPLVRLAGNLMSPDRCAGLQQRAGELIARQRGPIWLLSSDAAAGAEAQALLSRHYGLQASGACLSYPSALDNARLCPQRRLPAATLACYRN